LRLSKASERSEDDESSEEAWDAQHGDTSGAGGACSQAGRKPALGP
jgi:hypothetical protein